MPLDAGPVQDIGAAVEGDQIALVEHPLPRDSVHNLLIDRDAHGGRVVVVPPEVGVRPRALDRLGAHGVEPAGRHPRFHRLPQSSMDIGHHKARAPHMTHLIRCLDLNAVAQSHAYSYVWWRKRNDDRTRRHVIVRGRAVAGSRVRQPRKGRAQS